MAWTEHTESLLCEIALQGCKETIHILGVRLNKDPEYRRAFRDSSLDLFHQLWPIDATTDHTRHLVLINRDIEEMPLDLQEELSDCLTRLTRTQSDMSPSARGAAKLLAGWLRCRAIERRETGVAGSDALRLKNQHALLFSKLFEAREPESAA